MNLRQLLAFRMLVDSGFNVSRTAKALNSSQPLVSRHIQSLEQRLGVQLFYRSRRRLTGLTRAGEAIFGVVHRIIMEMETIDTIAREFSSPDTGVLTVATTHTYARHFLPDILKRFVRQFPRVRIVLKQGSPQENAREVACGTADLFIASEPDPSLQTDIVLIPFMRLDRIILVAAGHPLLDRPKPTLKEIASYPLITFSAAFSARAGVLEAFEKSRLTPNIVLTATDAEVIKTYVRQGMGIAILSTLSHEPNDRGLMAIDARHLFRPNTVYIGLRRHSFLRDHSMALIKMVAPTINRSVVERELVESIGEKIGRKGP